MITIDIHSLPKSPSAANSLSGTISDPAGGQGRSGGGGVLIFSGPAPVAIGNASRRSFADRDRLIKVQPPGLIQLALKFTC